MSITKPYMHGGNLNDAAQRYGITLKQPVTDFSVNINPLGPPDIIRRLWPDWFSSISEYPSQNGRGIKRYYRKRFNLPEESVLAGNGSIELIYLVPRALKIKKAVIFTPSFHDYHRSCLSAGAKVIELPLIKSHNTDYPLDDKSLGLISESDAVFFGNPNNPTGSLLDCKIILNLAKRYPHTWFLIDEAFSQFLENPEKYSLLARHTLSENIIVFHSLTKFYALPGLRMGAAVSHPKTIARLSHFKEPWTVNALAEKAADILVDCNEYETKTRQIITEQRNLLFHAINCIPAIRLFETPANFIFARLNGARDMNDLICRLLNKGLFIRDCRNFKGLDGSFFRIAVREKEDNLCLIMALTDIFGNKND